MTRRELLKTAPVAGLAPFLFSGCTSSELTATVEAVTVAAEAALAALGATTVLPPGLANELSTYLVACGQGITDTTAELATMDSNAVKAAKIAAIWTAAVLPNLPAGLPAGLTAAFVAVQAAIKALLGSLAPVTAALRSRDPYVFNAVQKKADQYKLSRKDKKRMDDYAKRGQAIRDKAATIKK